MNPFHVGWRSRTQGVAGTTGQAPKQKTKEIACLSSDRSLGGKSRFDRGWRLVGSAGQVRSGVWLREEGLNRGGCHRWAVRRFLLEEQVVRWSRSGVPGRCGMGSELVDPRNPVVRLYRLVPEVFDDQLRPVRSPVPLAPIWRASSPTLERIWSIRCLAFSASGESGCCWTTSL